VGNRRARHLCQKPPAIATIERRQPRTALFRASGPPKAAGGPEGTGPDRPHHDVDLKDTDSGSGRTGRLALRSRRLAAERFRRHRKPFGRAKATIAHSTYQRLQKS